MAITSAPTEEEVRALADNPKYITEYTAEGKIKSIKSEPIIYDEGRSSGVQTKTYGSYSEEVYLFENGKLQKATETQRYTADTGAGGSFTIATYPKWTYTYENGELVKHTYMGMGSTERGREIPFVKEVKDYEIDKIVAKDDPTAVSTPKPKPVSIPTTPTLAPPPEGAIKDPQTSKPIIYTGAGEQYYKLPTGEKIDIETGGVLSIPTPVPTTREEFAESLFGKMGYEVEKEKGLLTVEKEGRKEYIELGTETYDPTKGVTTKEGEQYPTTFKPSEIIADLPATAKLSPTLTKKLPLTPTDILTPTKAPEELGVSTKEAPDIFTKAYGFEVPKEMRTAKIEKTRGDIAGEVLYRVATIPTHGDIFLPEEQKELKKEYFREVIREFEEDPIKATIIYGVGFGIGGGAGVLGKVVPKVFKPASYLITAGVTGVYAGTLTHETITTPEEDLPKLFAEETVEAGAFILGMSSGAKAFGVISGMVKPPVKIRADTASEILVLRGKEKVVTVTAPKKVIATVGKDKYVIDVAGITTTKIKKPPIIKTDVTLKGKDISKLKVTKEKLKVTETTKGQFEYIIKQDGKIVDIKTQTIRGISKQLKDGYIGIYEAKVPGKKIPSVIVTRGKEIIPGERYKFKTIKAPEPTIEVGVTKRTDVSLDKVKELWSERSKVVGKQEFLKKYGERFIKDTGIKVKDIIIIKGKRGELILKTKQVEGIVKKVPKPKPRVPKEPISAFERAGITDAVKAIQKSKFDFPRVPILLPPTTIPDITKTIPPPPMEKITPIEKVTPIVKQTPITKQIPITKQMPITEQPPMEKITPIEKVIPIMKQSPITKQIPITKQMPITEQPPIEKVTPIVKQTPITKQIPITKQMPITEQPPITKRPSPIGLLPPIPLLWRESYFGRRARKPKEKRKYRYMPSVVSYEYKLYDRIKKGVIYSPTKVRKIPREYRGILERAEVMKGAYKTPKFRRRKRRRL